VRIFSFLIIFSFLFLGCESQLGETTIKSLSGKSYGPQIRNRVELIADINLAGGTGALDIGNEIVIPGGILFSAFHVLFGDELYFYDFQEGTAYLVDDLNFGADGSFPRNFKRFGNYVYFFAETATEGSELRRVNVNNPTYIESFDAFVGQSMIPAIDDDPTNGGNVNYIVAKNNLYIFYSDTFDHLERVNLSTLEFSNINFYDTNFFVQATMYAERVGNRIYFAGFEANTYADLKLMFINLNSNLDQINVVNDASLSIPSSINAKAYGNYLIFAGFEPGNSTRQLYAHDGNNTYLLDFLGNYGSGPTESVFNRSDAIQVAGNNLFAIGTDANFYKIDITDVANPSAMNTDFDTINSYMGFYPAGNNICSYASHGSSGAATDLVCYIDNSGLTYLFKTNYSGDLGLNVIQSVEGAYTTNTNGDMVGGPVAYLNGNIYFTAQDDATQYNFYQVDLTTTTPTMSILESATNNMNALASASGEHVYLHDGASNYIIHDTIAATSQISQSINYSSGGDLLNSDSSNAKIVFENDTYLISLLTEITNKIVSLPTGPSSLGEIAIYNKETNTLNKTGLNGLLTSHEHPKAVFNKVVGDYWFFEVEEVAGLSSIFRFNLANGSYTIINLDGASGDAHWTRLIDIKIINGIYTFFGLDDSGNFVVRYLNDLDRLINIYSPSNNLYSKIIMHNNDAFMALNIGGTEGIYRIYESSGVITYTLIKENTSINIFANIYVIHGDANYIYVSEVTDSLGHMTYDGAQSYGSFVGADGSAAMSFSTGYEAIPVPIGNRIYVQNRVHTAGDDFGYIDFDASNNPSFVSLGLTVDGVRINSRFDTPYIIVGDDALKVTSSGTEPLVTNHLNNTDCSMGFEATTKDFFTQEGVLRYDFTGPNLICAIRSDGQEAINFMDFGFSQTNTYELKLVSDQGGRVVIIVNEDLGASVKSYLIEINFFNTTLTILSSKILEDADQADGYQLGNEVIYCDNNLYTYNLDTADFNQINQRYICDPKLMQKASDGEGVYFNGADRDNYVGFEIYRVNAN
jgi:ELWxxDGT repeat protein